MRSSFTLVKKIALDRRQPDLLHCTDDFRSNHFHPPQQRQRPASVAIGVATTSLALKSVVPAVSADSTRSGNSKKSSSIRQYNQAVTGYP